VGSDRLIDRACARVGAAAVMAPHLYRHILELTKKRGRVAGTQTMTPACARMAEMGFQLITVASDGVFNWPGGDGVCARGQTQTLN